MYMEHTFTTELIAIQRLLKRQWSNYSSRNSSSRNSIIYSGSGRSGVFIYKEMEMNLEY